MDFHLKKLLPSLYSVTDIAGTHCFLVTGTKKAALIDTGIGFGSLKSYIREITDLPLIVIGTHGHLDHMGGSREFDKVYLNSKDFSLAYQQNIGERFNYARNMYEMLNKESQWSVKMGDFLPVKTSGYAALEMIETFNLGNVTLRPLPLPGHTQGSEAILLEEARTIIFGDACNPGVFLFDETASTVDQYRMTLEKFKRAYEKFYDRVIVSHGEEFIDKVILDNTIDVCREILEGSDDHIPVLFHGRQAYSAKKTGAFGKRLDGKIGNILYDPKKIY